MTIPTKPGKPDEAPFYFTEECGLALMQSRRTGKKLAVEMETWGDVVSGLRAGWHPDAGGARQTKG